MSESPTEPYDWKPLALEIPSESDFDPYHGDLDAQSAWKEFGEMSLEEAYDYFLDCAENRQEDFMFMGPRAFFFYFPIVERYLYSIRTVSEWDYCQAWILGHALISQLKNPLQTQENGLRGRIAKLAEYVRAHLDQYALADGEQAKIDGAWSELQGMLLSEHPE